MTRQLEAPRDQIRVVFRLHEAVGFLRGWEPVPNHGGDDPLNRAIQHVYDALNDAFPDAGDLVELLPEPARWAEAGGFDWHVVNFRFPEDPVETVGHDPDALARWLAEHTPDLLFALEDEDERPIPIRRIRRHVA